MLHYTTHQRSPGHSFYARGHGAKAWGTSLGDFGKRFDHLLRDGPRPYQYPLALHLP